MIFNETKCHVNTSLGLVGGMYPLHSPPYPLLNDRLDFDFVRKFVNICISLKDP